MKATTIDVIILLPGIMGSALARDGKPIWDLSAGALGSFLGSLGGSIQGLSPSSDASGGDGVVPTHILRDTHLLPFLWKIDGYSEFSKYLQEKFDLTPGENFVEFPYDWRVDNRISARRLKSIAMEKLDDQRTRHADAKLVLIAHSMGGLVSRYFLEALDGWKDTRMLITFGTPFRGSMKALDFLVNGVRKKIGPITLLDLTNLVRSLPSIYQLLPSYECVGKTENELEGLEMISEVGDLDMGLARAGIGFHREIERKAEENKENAEYIGSRYKFVPIVGTYQPTFLSAVLTKDGIKPIYTHKGRTLLRGDGTVPRIAATPLGQKDAIVETFVACPHASLQNFDPVRVQSRSALEDMDIGEIKAVSEEAISLEIRDAYHCSERFTARAQCPTAIKPMEAVIINTLSKEEYSCATETEKGDEVWHRFEYDALPAGSYRIEVETGDGAEPISDVFAVVA